MTVQPWRATCIQMHSEVASNAPDRASAWAIIEANIAHAIELIDRACDGPNPPKLVVLPEFVFQGPPRATPVSQWIDKACANIPGPITDRLAVVAKERGIYIAGNHFEVDPRWPDRYFNSSFLLNDEGEVILRYRRINTASWTSPHDILDDYREAYGEEGIFPVADTPLGKLAIFPCGEVNVPELARVFMLRGAEVLLHPHNGPVTAPSEAAKTCRAAENMCYLISANVAGGIGFSADGSEQGGQSRIIDYLGNDAAAATGAAETVDVTAIIDVEALRRARRDMGMGNMLMRSRFAMYRDYYAKADFYPANGLAAGAFETYPELTRLQEQALANMTKAGVLR
jgi:predicted amidohydrolase